MACFRRGRNRLVGLAVLIASLGAPASWAQSPVDTTATTDRATLPLRDRSLDVAGLLAPIPGSFLYDFGTPGWPDAWSPYGLDPRMAGARFDELPYDDPITGAPVWELLPLAQMEPLETTAALAGRPDVVRADFRHFEAERPLTEMRYRSSAGGLQAVDVNHVQRRRLGSGTFATVLFGYGGAGARGEYEGSRLRRKRHVVGRIGIDRGDWAVALLEIHNRYRVGAHGGVEPIPGYGYQSVYNRLAGVENPSAQRVRYRNDLVVSATGPVIGGTLDTRAFWTTATLRYRTDTDTTTARTSGLGLAATWTPPLPIEIRLDATTDAVRSGDAFAGSPGPTRILDVSVTARPAFGSATAEVMLDAGRMNGYTIAGGHAGIGWTAGAVRLHGSVTSAHKALSPVERQGFGQTFVGEPDARPARSVRALAGMELRAGALHVALSGFARSAHDVLLLLLDATGDSVRATPAPASVRRHGVVVEAGLRERAASGPYLSGSFTWSPTSAEQDPLLRRAIEAWPTLFGHVRLGLRALLFSGDLDLDLAVQARSWAGTQGMRLHAPTGLLALPDPDARPVPASTVLDVTADAGVRSATIFLALENVLSGTTLVPGNQLVPDYPYPERRFRFGVYWPIFD